jgi:hypothetical protein
VNKIDSILYAKGSNTWKRQQIQNLFLELVGEDIQKTTEVEGSTVAKYYVNRKLAELRAKVPTL